MNVLTWDGYDINDTTNYTAFIASPELGNAPVSANMVGRHGRYPLVGGITWPDNRIVMEIGIWAATPTTARATLRTIFETESGEVKTLIVEGDDTTEQYVQAICEAFYEINNSPLTFQVVLRVHDDPAWRSTELQTDTETVTASEQQWTITNAGDQIARPVITITPTTTHSGINPYRRFVAVRWFGRAANRYPVDITNNAWDTAALIANAANSVQVNQGGGINNSVTTIPYDTVTGTFPSSGMAYIDTEQITYTGKTGTTSGNLTGVTRGVNGTSAASHADNAVIYSSKMQANGDDIRVLVNGVFTSFWLDDVNSNNTSVWLPLNFIDNVFERPLATAIASSGTVETIDVDQDISNYPPQGILLIDSELFLYIDKNNTLQRFTISARAAHGTAMAAHTATTAVHLIQHAIEIQYGNSALAAYAVTDDGHEPVITLASSSNLAWDYDNFGGFGTDADYSVPRPGSWQHTGQYMFTNWIWTWYNETQFPNYPAGNPDTDNPYTVMGLYQHQASNVSPRPQRWLLDCPCGLTAANFTNGYKRANYRESTWRGYVRSASRSNGAWMIDYTIPVPSVAATWQTWSQNITSPQGNRYIALDLEAFYGGNSNTPAGFFVEVADVLVTFDSAMCPTSYLAPERGNYTIEAELIHVESGLSLAITFPTTLNNSLVINTDTGEITDESDGSSQFQAVRRLPRSRVEWLPLLPGVNTLQWNEAGVAGVDVTFDWRERRGA